MKILCVGDPHFKVTKFPQRQQLMVDEILRQVKTTNPDVVVVLGDVLNDHEKIHVSSLCPASNFLKELANFTTTYVLVGNHDLKNNKQYLVSEHSLSPLKGYHNLVIVDFPLRVNDLIFTPYVPPGRFEEALNNIPDWKTAKIIFAHQEFYGCNLDGTTSTEGDVWPETGRPLVVSGHIHKYHHLPGIIYPGTPMQHTYGEDNNKGLSLLTIDPQGSIDHQRLTLNIPSKIVIEIIGSQVSDLELPPGYDIKLIIKASPGENRGIRKHPKVKDWERQGVKIIFQDQKPEYIPVKLRKASYTDRVVEQINYYAEKDDLLKILQYITRS